jgi:LysM repeat protein
MGSLRQIGAGFLLGVITIAAVIGGFALSRAEGGVGIIGPSITASPSTVMITIYPTIPLLTDTPQAMVSESITDTPAPTSTLPASATPPPPPVSCLPPAGWLAIQVQGYDTLFSLAQIYQTSVDAIKQGNCLFSDQLVVGSFLYVPPRPTATFIPCGAPSGWGTYYVVAGDTLYNISLRYRVTVVDLQRANCMGSSTFIATGKPLRVPNVPTSTSSVNTSTWTASPTLEVASPTPSPSATMILVPTTEVPTITPTPTPTATVIIQPSPTHTTEPTSTVTPTIPASSTG